MGGNYSQDHSICAIINAMRSVGTEQMQISYWVERPTRMNVSTGVVLESKPELITITIEITSNDEDD